ncbi:MULTISPECIES: DNA polymerase IV [Mesorhizobium]|uniref:DNA polymerase IV n=1 Tax=Mesorhizobium sp. TaxID=1871066 RepID=UPI0004947915|nr:MULTISPECIES: DNA polymerase IV [Mesorhizobium]RWI08810.1 MAG: DNA polymerase IV [Mesorhizobium sp.]RWM66480.1 MAG: DNA polymerase IV [Mesorhizobium sp.]RWM85746.1 MAG: DNA polymerase IV [Mesorhizobium sp.]TIO21409.1 MAG: DNA polymerase IV [Mesorhizobium sp.]TJV54967.1 MAG: DNA polymerase IV [Mesorhizobium sp.]
MDKTDEAPAPRKIIHVDMDAFYASVEQRDNPDLRGKPVAVGSSQHRGVVAAASYEARKFGVHSAMASVTAKRKCPDLIFVPHRFDVYRDVSRQIHEIFAEHTPLIEPLSLDEAYLDVTENLQKIDTATEVAEAICAKIKAVTNLTASAGVSYNKFLAKMASGQNKPDGLFVITPKAGPAFVETLPVGKFHGVGPATAEKMKRLGIETGLDLKARSLASLQSDFGRSGSYYYWISRGIDERPVQPDRVRKSIGAEDTFSKDVFSEEDAAQGLRPLLEKVWRYCAANAIRGRTVTLKVKYSDFQQITRSRTAASAIASQTDFEQVATGLLAAIFPPRKGIRLLGILLSGLGDEADDDTQLRFDI